MINYLYLYLDKNEIIQLQHCTFLNKRIHSGFKVMPLIIEGNLTDSTFGVVF